MALAPGTRLGPYEIESPLGAGGMGEVYRARDTRLDRAVAVKVLPGELTRHPEARQRFEREARAVSSLNHPNICTLHDVGREGDIEYLVLELLDGESLAQRLERGRLPLAEALRVGIQVAEGLDRAHRQGVLHRDLKPGNIFLTRTGAKLLDFGLAKSAGLPGAADVSATAVPTVMSPLTSEGAIVGTFQYMSPEQLSGQEADTRSDLFAFGLVLFEMITGTKAFQGKTQATLIGAILHAEPPPLASLQPEAPPALQRLLSRALAKDPEERWQSAGDLKAELKWIAGEESSSAGGRGAVAPGSTGAAQVPGPVSAVTGVHAAAAGVPSGVSHAIPSRSPMAGRERLAWLLAAVSLVAALGLAAWSLRPAPASTRGPTLRASVMPPGNLTTFGDRLQSAAGIALSRDGSRLAFFADDKLWVQNLSQPEARPVLDQPKTWSLFWSYDGRRVGFFSDGKLKTVAADGGAPITVCDAVEGRGGYWAGDGTIYFAPGLRTGIYAVSADGGQPAPITTVQAPKHSSHRWPHLMPDGRHLLFLALNHANPRGSDTGIYAVDLGDGMVKFLTRSDAGPVYGHGHLLYMRSGSLYARPLDPQTMEFTGEEIRLAENVLYHGGSWVGAFDASENGPLIFVSTGQPMGTRLTWFDLDGTAGEELTGLDVHWGFRLSPDGRRLAVAKGDPEPALYILEPGRNTQSRIAASAGFTRAPTWAPGGDRLAFAGFHQGLLSIFQVPVDGASEPELIHSADTDVVPTDWSPDGRYLLMDQGPPGNTQVWVLDLETGESHALVDTPPLAGDGRFSPDGRWVIYSSRETGSDQLYLIPFPPADRRWQVSSDGGSFGRWLGADRILFSGNQALNSASFRVEEGEVRLGAPEELFPVETDNPVYIGWEGITEPGPDGRRVLVSYRKFTRVTTPMTLVLNWQNELERDQR